MTASKTSRNSAGAHVEKTNVTENLSAIRSMIAKHNARFLDHEYFRRCEDGRMSRTQLIEVVKQLYCFSVFFERLLTSRVAQYSSTMDGRVLSIARRHLREELGHADLFYNCLLQNGVSPAELANVAPRTFTKAVFGYLMATIQYESEFVTNVALMQVLEGIAYLFFVRTLAVMKSHGLVAQALETHTEDDEDHAELGVELIAGFDARVMDDSRRIIRDIYHLIELMLEEWVEATLAIDGDEPRHKSGIVLSKGRGNVGSVAIGGEK